MLKLKKKLVLITQLQTTKQLQSDCFTRSILLSDTVTRLKSIALEIYLFCLSGFSITSDDGRYQIGWGTFADTRRPILPTTCVSSNKSARVGIYKQGF